MGCELKLKFAVELSGRMGVRGEDVRGECAGEVRGLARLPSIFFLVLPPLPRAAIKVNIL